MNITNSIQGQRIYPQQIQNDIFATNVLVNCDPRLKGPPPTKNALILNTKASAFDNPLNQESQAGMLGVETEVCDLTISGTLKVKGDLFAPNIVNRIIAGTNVNIAPVSGTGDVIVNAQPTAGTLLLPIGTSYGNYFYWNTGPGQWNVGGDAADLSRIHLGDDAGASGQSDGAVAIGAEAGRTDQGANGVAIGIQAGFDTQQEAAIAIGPGAGQTGQGFRSVAIGNTAGNNTQGNSAVAIGDGAAGTLTGQGDESIAIGRNTGWHGSQKTIAIGSEAGQTQKYRSCSHW